MPKEVKKVKPGKGKAKKVILTIAIAILFVLFVAYAIETIYPSPKYEDLCPTVNFPIENQSLCEQNNGTWIKSTNSGPDKAISAPISGYCDTYSKCQKPFNDASEIYNRNLFFITLVIGLIVLVLSFIFKVEAVSAGFMLGSIILIVYGTIRYWGNLSDVWRTIMLGFALIVLVWIGYKKLK